MSEGVMVGLVVVVGASAIAAIVGLVLWDLRASRERRKHPRTDD